MARIDWRDAVAPLRRDNRSGADEIANDAVNILIDLVGDSAPGNITSYRRWLLDVAREVVAAQPAMASLFRLVNDMLWACYEADEARVLRQLALDHLQDHQMRVGAASLAVTEHAVTELARYDALMTYSRSSTVCRALTAPSARRRRVYCGEGRPMLEGQTLAHELAWAGLQVTIGADMALFDWLSQVDALVIGADSVSRAGIVNKLGTAPLMRAAAEREIPRIVLATTDKLLPHDYVHDVQLWEAAPQEIMPVSNENITVRNVYFDVTPLELVTAVITEEGLRQGAQINESLADVRTYPGLRGRSAV